MTDHGEALRSAVRRADSEAVQRLLSESRAYTDASDDFGNTALHWAVMGGYAEIVVLLLAAGTNPNSMNKEGVTALWLAKDFGLDEIVTQLVRHGARE